MRPLPRVPAWGVKAVDDELIPTCKFDHTSVKGLWRRRGMGNESDKPLFVDKVTDLIVKELVWNPEYFKTHWLKPSESNNESERPIFPSWLEFTKPMTNEEKQAAKAPWVSVNTKSTDK